jgi:hypothetical protein
MLNARNHTAPAKARQATKRDIVSDVEFFRRQYLRILYLHAAAANISSERSGRLITADAARVRRDQVTPR